MKRKKFQRENSKIVWEYVLKYLCDIQGSDIVWSGIVRTGVPIQRL